MRYEGIVEQFESEMFLPATDGRAKYRDRLARSIAVIIVGWSLLVAAEQRSAPDGQAPVMTPVAVGQEMFRAYCVSCHGLDGKGHGPAAPTLKKPSPDLTLLSKRNGGTFPGGQIRSVLEGNDFITAHGSRDMPIWGAAFRIVDADPSMVQLKVDNLVAYVESIQQK